jgi:hypothetical protein
MSGEGIRQATRWQRGGSDVSWRVILRCEMRGEEECGICNNLFDLRSRMKVYLLKKHLLILTLSG